MLSSLRPVQSGTVGLLAMALAIGAVLSSDVQAQQKPTQGKKPAPTQATPTTPTQAAATRTNSDALDIKIETFRKQIAAGTPYGVAADITNNSGAPVYLRQRDVQLVLPLDIERQATSTEGWFPTEYCLKDCPTNCPQGCGQPNQLALPPGETYRVFWSPKGRETTCFAGNGMVSCAWQQFLQFINFAPGVYPITVEAKYWDKKESLGGDGYHTVVQTKDAEFVASQGMILSGAILGGLIFAFLSMIRAKESAPKGTKAEPQHPAKIWGKGLLVIAGSILLSVIITILLSRIEQTQFLIKVTVSDFWGAIAIGFLANYGGWTVIDKMIPGGKKDKHAGHKPEQDKTKGPTQTPADPEATT